MDAATFRTDFPEFSNTVTYTDAMVNFRLVLGAKLMDLTRWGDLFDPGLELYTAHYLALGRMAAQAAAIGAAPGAVEGPITAKAVDKVSLARDAASVTLEGGGHWNSTIYGVQYYQLLRQVGMGGMQL